MGSCIGRAGRGPETTGRQTGVGTTRGAGLTCWSCLGGRTVGCGIPALGAVLVITAVRGFHCTIGDGVTRVRVTEEGADNLTVCPVTLYPSMGTNGRCWAAADLSASCFACSRIRLIFCLVSVDSSSDSLDFPPSALR